MLIIILKIIKILGITLLVILGLILLLILLLLFAPFRYKINGELNSEIMQAGGKVSWLLHLFVVKVNISKTDKLQIIFKILGIPIYDTGRTNKFLFKRTKKTTAGTKKKSKNENNNTHIIETNIDENQTDNTELKCAEINEKELNSAEIDENDKKSINLDKTEINDEKIEAAHDQKNKESEIPCEVKNDEKNSENSTIEHDKNSFLHKIRIFFEKIIQFIKNIKYTFQKFCDTITNVEDNIKSFTNFWNEESTQRAIAKCKEQLLAILGMILPKKFNMNLHVGFEDPLITGNLMAFLGILYPLHKGNIKISPEFEHEGSMLFEGDISIKGKITLFVLLKAGLIFIFDKDIKQLRKTIKK